MIGTYDCEVCGEEHGTGTDSDGYELAFCPKRGTIIAAYPEERGS